ncbi:MAG: MG2 domain-containing protein [Armatimonadota bacterium]|nr:MG2 domain-containing protein [Armatimonadota bacterium]
MRIPRVIGNSAACLAAGLFALGLFGAAIMRQVPVGSLEGTVIAEESGNLIPAWVRIYPVADTRREQEEEGSYYTDTRDGRFRFERVPAGEYVLHVGAPWRQSVRTKVRIEEGEVTAASIEVPVGQPNFSIYTAQHIFTPDERGEVVCEGYIESNALQLHFYRVELDRFIAVYGANLGFLLSSYGELPRRPFLGSMYRPRRLMESSLLRLEASTSAVITRRRPDGSFTRRIRLPQLPAGFYLLSVEADGVRRNDWLMVTSLGLIAKTSGSKVLAMVVNLKTGAAINGARVDLYSDSESTASGVTDADGLVHLEERGGRGGYGERKLVARYRDEFAIVSTYVFSQAGEQDYLVYSYTDRPVYRPGHKVYFRGIVRKTTGSGYSTPTGKDVTVSVRDPNDTLLYRANYTTDEFGCYHGDFTLNPETMSGTYTLVTVVGKEGGEHISTFAVSSYIKPEFSVNVSFPEKRYTRGDFVTAKIKAEYYFGGPVANAKVTYYITRTDYWFGGESDYDFDYFEADSEGYAGYGEPVQRGTLRTDRDGTAEITFRADWPRPQDDYDWDTDQQFVVEVYVQDPSRREQTASASVLVTRGEFALFVQPDRYVVKPGSRVVAALQAKEYEGRPAAGRDLKVVIGRQVYDKGSVRFNKWLERMVTTDKTGQASVTFTPKDEGDLRILVSARDDEGNLITASAWVWCFGGAYEQIPGARYGELTIVTDKKSYTVGEIAKVAISSAHPGAVALVTVEGEKVYDYFVVQCKGKTTLFELPVREEYKPNFYIGVCFVRNKRFVNQQVRVKVNLDPQTIYVTVRPDKVRYHPRERATYTIFTRDLSGRPVDSQLSIGVVDEAVYAIRKDDTIPILDFFYSKRPNEVETQFSFPEVYFSGPDKTGDLVAERRAPKPPIVRKRFLDTAFWQADIRTGADGKAVVSFVLPDNLGKWRATVRAITPDTRCGQVVTSVTASQEMLVRLQTPRFLVQGDRALITAVVHNYTGSQDTVKVSLRAGRLKVKGRCSWQGKVPAGGYRRIDWVATASRPGIAVLTASARGSRNGDAVQLALPVYAHGEERRATRAGALGSMRGSEVFTVYVRQDAIKELLRLRIRLAPTLACTLLGALDYLARYPYGCTEQTVSSFLPDVVLYRALDSLVLRNPELKNKLPDMVRTGLLRLYKMQMADGGWGWCEYGKSDPWMTAYVCYGLIQARKAGFSLNDSVLSRGLDWLADSLGRENLKTELEAFACYVLALAGRNVTETLDLLTYAKDARTLAYTCLAYSALGKRAQADAVLDRLFTLAVVEPPFIYWRDGESYAGDDVETTALALQALLRVRSQDPRAYKIAAWLVDKRRGAYWYSTRDTAITLCAMAEFLRLTKELAPHFRAEVRVNGKPYKSVVFAPGSIFEPDKVLTLDARHLRKGPNRIEITKNGRGNLYYTSELVQWIFKDRTRVRLYGSGLSVSREYYKLDRSLSMEVNRDVLGKPVNSCSSGDVILVRLTICSSSRRRHLLVEDFVPAGCEIADRGQIEYYEWTEWYVGKDVKDNKISFYVESLPAGKKILEYRMRAVVPGEYCALPAQVFAMYEPFIHCATGDARFVVR